MDIAVRAARYSTVFLLLDFRASIQTGSGNESPAQESATSLAMYSCLAFSTWREELSVSGVDLRAFMKIEIDQNNVVHRGWTQQTLLDVSNIRHPFRKDGRINWECADCKITFGSVDEGGFGEIKVQPYRRHLLQSIRQGLRPFCFETGKEGNEDDSSHSGFTNRYNNVCQYLQCLEMFLIGSQTYTWIMIGTPRPSMISIDIRRGYHFSLRVFTKKKR